MFKPYFIHKRKRYGFANSVKTIFGDITTVEYYISKSVAIAVSTFLIGLIVGFLPNPKVVTLLNIPIFLIGVLIAGYFVFISTRCSCVYCSTKKEDVEQFIVKTSTRNPHFKELITDIKFDEGWYMIFLKPAKELYDDMLNSPNTYTRPYPKEFKRARSIMYIVVGVAIAASIGVAFVCSVFDVVRSLSEVLLVLPAFLFYSI